MLEDVDHCPNDSQSCIMETEQSSPKKEDLSLPKNEDRSSSKIEDRSSQQNEDQSTKQSTTNGQEGRESLSDPLTGKGVKRSTDTNVGRTVKRRKTHGLVQEKNAVCHLNEIHPGLKYQTVSQSGPIHCPLFEVSVTLNGEEYKGCGSSKKIAKHKAAVAALASFVQFANPDEAHRVLNKPTCNLDFTSDDINESFEKPDCNENIECHEESTSGLPSVRLSPSPQIPNKNPVMALNELHPYLNYELVGECGEPHNKIFTMKVNVDGHSFEGQGGSKKLARAAAAKLALATLHNRKWISAEQQDTDVEISSVVDKLPQLLTDYIARVISNKFLTLTAHYPTYSKRKVLAGVVISRGDPWEVEVIAVSTGTKCISGERMSVSGGSVNDCHAEIIARRCLLDFFYSQLELHLDRHTAEKSIFLPDYENGGFRLKEGVRFSMYISTAPCGDARIFSPHEASEGEIDRHPNRKARGKLRTKVESGEGSIPVKPDESVLTWDGVLQGGQRLLTMSCSDKMAKWNILGVQGSLLSHFLPPIYLDNVIVGSLFHPQHIYRALCGRLLDIIRGLSPPFIVHTPFLNVTSNPEQREVSKPPNFSLNWTVGMENFELVLCNTGKTDQGHVSRLAKCRFFQRFRNLYAKIPSFFKADVEQPPIRYIDAKLASTGYQQAKEQLFSAFTKSDLGIWVKKPVEQDQFEFDILYPTNLEVMAVNMLKTIDEGIAKVQG